MTEFSDADLDRVLAEARATLESIRVRRPDAEPVDVPDGAGAEAEGAGSGADGRIRVTAAPGGRLSAVELDPEAMRLSSEEFGRQLVLAANAALDDARARNAARPAKPEGDETEDGTGDDGAEQDPGLRQMALLTRAINEALARIG
ncbi:YbaB/EbfC family DNA-binding protein [Actinomadura rugatobispora]|uniref:YbaB/EbfC family DNA-binding protein n=1 Tax=Actinomadura rugatobispora TaxID=1994 RepID=A0ABW0ZVG5_9ACTN